MGAFHVISEEYREIYEVNLQKNKKIAVIINLLATFIGIAMIVIMAFFVPVRYLFYMDDGIGMYFVRFAVLIAAMVIYMILHEMVHGITMKAFGTKKVKYGFTGLYAYAGSDDYYDKKSYIVIALAPIVVFAAIFAVVNLIVPREWFWIVYLLQVCNISGAAGDIFVTAKFIKMPKDILVRDSGVGMTVYSKERV